MEEGREQGARHREDRSWALSRADLRSVDGQTDGKGQLALDQGPEKLIPLKEIPLEGAGRERLRGCEIERE